MLTGIHFLLTYKCTRECDHCFVFGSPQAEGTFTLSQLNAVFKEIAKIRTVNCVYFEGGEPFLYYPLLLEGVRMAHDSGLKTGIVTNAYWATTEQDATLWLQPFVELGISDLSISEDSFHSNEDNDNFGKHAQLAAENLGIPADTICIEKPEVKLSIEREQAKGDPIIGGGVRFKGRAVEQLITDLPLRQWNKFTSCPYEELESPKRVHIDAYGNVHICQGIIIGNMWETPLSRLIESYKWNTHAICRPLVHGGPAYLVKEYDIKHDEAYVDACHLCYQTRKILIDKFPKYLAPRQVYGL